MNRLRAATYNVHKCKGLDWRVSPLRIAEVICGLKADLVATQEILLSQAEAIAAHTGLPFAFGEARQHRGEPYGNAVFTNLPIVESEKFDLTVRGHEPRMCLRVTVRTKAAVAIHCFAVHLGTSFRERREQGRRLVGTEILERTKAEGTRLVLGDFNEWPRGLATQLLGRHLQSADVTMHLKRSRTYPGVLPFLHLDHIYYDFELQLRSLCLVRNGLAVLASDHLPLVAEFEIRAPATVV